MRTDNLFTLAIFWKKKWERGEAGSTVDSHVLSQQMWGVGPCTVSPWHQATAWWWGANASQTKPSPYHGTLTSPRPLCCWSIQSHTSPFIQSLFEAGQTASGGPPPPSARAEMAYCLQSLVQRLWAAELTGFIPKGFYMPPVHLSRPLSRGGSEYSSWRLQHAYWMGNHRPEKVSATPPATPPAPEWVPANGPSLIAGPHLNTLPFLQGNETPYKAVTTWSTHCIPQGSPMETGADSRSVSSFSQFGGAQVCRSELRVGWAEKNKAKSWSPYRSSCKWDMTTPMEGEPESASSYVIYTKVQYLHLLGKWLKWASRTLECQSKTGLAWKNKLHFKEGGNLCNFASPRHALILDVSQEGTAD